MQILSKSIAANLNLRAPLPNRVGWLVGMILVLFGNTFVDRAEAQFTWSSSSAGTYNFSDDANWTDGVAPAASETELVTISAGVGTTVINFTADQQLLGGFNYNRRRGGDGVTTNLGTASSPIVLTIVGFLTINPTFTAIQLSFEHGTVQLGTGGGADTEATFNVGTGGAVPSLTVFSFGSTLNLQNVASFNVGATTGNTSPRATLDLSAATIRSGAQANRIEVKGGVSLGTYGTDFNSGRGGEGNLLLNSSWTSADWGSLTMAQNLRFNPSTNNKNFAEASLDLGGGSTAQELLVREGLIVGRGDNVEGEILNPSTNLELQVGVDAGDRAVEIWFGYKDRTQGNAADGPDNAAIGTFTAAGGNFTAYVEDLRVGQNTQPSIDGSAHGLLDLSAATLGVLDISGDARIGIGVNAEGDLRLRDGLVISQNLFLGDSQTGSFGRLDLDNTLWSIGDTLTIGESGTANLVVGDASSGFDILGSEAFRFDIDAGGVIEVSFEELAKVWAVRMAGDHVTLFEQYVADGRLVGGGEFGYLSMVEFDGTHTTFGIIPEPGILTMFMLAAILLLGTARGRVGRVLKKG